MEPRATERPREPGVARATTEAPARPTPSASPQVRARARCARRVYRLLGVALLAGSLVAAFIALGRTPTFDRPGGSAAGASADATARGATLTTAWLDQGPRPTEGHDMRRSSQSHLAGPANASPPRLVYRSHYPLHFDAAPVVSILSSSASERLRSGGLAPRPPEWPRPPGAPGRSDPSRKGQRGLPVGILTPAEPRGSFRFAGGRNDPPRFPSSASGRLRSGGLAARPPEWPRPPGAPGRSDPSRKGQRGLPVGVLMPAEPRGAFRFGRSAK